MEDELLLTASSLLRTVEGVAVAAKSHPDDVHLALQSLRLKVKQKGNIENASLSFGEWQAYLASTNAHHGVARQLLNMALAVALLREKGRGGFTVTAQELDVIWSMIHNAIMSAIDDKLRFAASRSAQGFLAVPLCSLIHEGQIEELFRLHVWLPDGQRGVPDVAVHSHQPFAQSWILAGYGTDYTVEVTSVDEPAAATHAAYEIAWAGSSQASGGYKTYQTSSTVTNTGRLVKVATGSAKVHTRDMSYVIPNGTYHRSVVPGNTLHATLFYFDAFRGFSKDAAVIGPKDGSHYTQPRDPAGNTPQALASITDAARTQEQGH